MKAYSIDYIQKFMTDVFRFCAVPEKDASIAAGVLATADLRGIESHGIARLKTYFDMLIKKRINPHPKIQVVRETASTATVDGDNGLGLVVGPRANHVAMEKAMESGTGWVSVCNSNHFGIAGYYVLQSLEEDLIGWSMTNSTKLVAPLWGNARMLGTNPIAIAFPGHKEPPIVIDMATCPAAYGQIEMAWRKGASIPEGWAIGADGTGTRSPEKMMDGGALLPLGSDRTRGGHKGYCLAIMVDVLSAILSGANWGPFVPPFAVSQETPQREVGKGVGHFFGAMRIDAFVDPHEFKTQIDAFIQELRTTKPAPGTNGPIIPGDPERQAEVLRAKMGIPLIKPVLQDLKEISEHTGIPFKTA
jgi:L-2-hydroxycarboxylate dehydrogenase (NAD+)